MLKKGRYQLTYCFFTSAIWEAQLRRAFKDVRKRIGRPGHFSSAHEEAKRSHPDGGPETRIDGSFPESGTPELLPTMSA